MGLPTVRLPGMDGGAPNNSLRPGPLPLGSTAVAMTPLELIPMRLAATVAHALPGIRLRVRHDDATVLEVSRSWRLPVPSVTPCAFRLAVASAHRRVDDGERLMFLGLPEGSTPTIDIQVLPTDCLYPGGIYRVTAADGVQILAFATTLSPRTCRTILTSHPSSAAIRLHHDAATDVTILHLTGPGDEQITEAPPMLEDLVASCFAEEVTLTLAHR